MSIHRYLMAAVGACALGAGVVAARADDHNAWIVDYDVAKAKAAKADKDLLINFSGSDWCGWCIKLDEEVFAHDVFQKKASENFVLVMIDSPSKPENKAKIPENLQKRYEELKKEFGVRGYPSVYLADAAGVVYAKTGYRKGGPEPYLEHLGVLRSQKVEKEKLMAKAGDTSLSDGERAKLLDQIIENTAVDMANKHHREDMAKIIELDGDNAAGLKIKYELRLRRIDAGAAMEKREYRQALELYDAILADLKPTGQHLQDVLFEKGAPHYYLKDNDGLRQSLEGALAAAPDGKKSAQIKAMMARFFPKEEVKDIIAE